MADIRLNPRNKAQWQALGYLLQFSKKTLFHPQSPLEVKTVYIKLRPY